MGGVLIKGGGGPTDKLNVNKQGVQIIGGG